MRSLLVALVLLGSLACRQAESSPLAAFQARQSPEIQSETRELVLKTHNSAHHDCQAQAAALRVLGFRTILAKNDSEDQVPTSIIRWEVQGCGTSFRYETQIQRISRHRDRFEKYYGISILPVYDLPGVPSR